MPKYSIVVPFHNEEENVTTLYDRLKEVMEHVGESFELVFVDDGSNDRTCRLLEEIAAVDSRVLVVKLRRNFGQTSALAAGFDHAEGDFILAMDGDLQHDPNEIPRLPREARRGVRRGQRVAQGAHRQFRHAPHSIALRQLADGEAFRRRYPRLRHHLQGLSPRSDPQHPALRRDAPLHPGAGFLVWRQHLRNSHHECESRARPVALRHRTDVPGLLRPDDHPLPAEVHDAAAALLRPLRRAGNFWRQRHLRPSSWL